ncbi:MAG: hypothetical protein CMM61_11980, partial [Rhodospirillaceae bacterium]|nr:hypothetical protein [Rhodospirillaceae bacterium]
MSGPKQLPIPFEHRPALQRDDYLVTSANAAAVDWIDRWPDWPGPLLCVWGPEDCGKSHLAQVFLAKSGGRLLAAPEAEAADRPGPFVIEDLDRPGADWDEEALFHMFNGLKSLAEIPLFHGDQWEITVPSLLGIDDEKDYDVRTKDKSKLLRMDAK